MARTHPRGSHRRFSPKREQRRLENERNRERRQREWREAWRGPPLIERVARAFERFMLGVLRAVRLA